MPRDLKNDPAEYMWREWAKQCYSNDADIDELREYKRAFLAGLWTMFNYHEALLNKVASEEILQDDAAAYWIHVEASLCRHQRDFGIEQDTYIED